MNNEIAGIQVGYVEIYETYAVVIAKINHSIVPAIHRLEQRMRLFAALSARSDREYHGVIRP